MRKTPQTHEVGTTVHVAPGDLLLQRNIREAKPDADLSASVKAVGVLEPITAVLTAEGGLLVRYGHRRTLAAIDAGTETVPVYIVGTDADDNASEIARIIRQRDENTHRAGLTVAEDVSVVQTLTGLGLSAAQVVKQARIKRADVDTALIVAGSSIASKAAERYEALTLDQAAVVAEFEDDAETVKALVVAAVEGKFDHVAQQARDARAEQAARQRVCDALTKAGVPLTDRPSYDERSVLRLSRLSAQDKGYDSISVEDHATCPGHVAWLETEWVRVGPDGEVVDYPEEPEADESTDDGAKAWEAYEAEYERVRTTSRQAQRALAVYGCGQWKAQGHRDLHATSSGTASRVPAAEQSPEEREAAKVQRKLVIDNNKAWAAAQPVRREFLATLARVKTPPKGAGRFLAVAAWKDPDAGRSSGGNEIAAEALKVKVGTGYGYTDLTPPKSATDARCTVVALVQVLANYEASLTDGSWRYDGTTNATGRYLRFLAECGYPLSEVEKYAISKKTA
jgi:ParB family chromosome partitioning protein